MPDCVIKIDGKDYVPVRAITAITVNRFDPLTITHLLGGDDPYAFLKSYFIEASGLVEAKPIAWHFEQDKQRLLGQKGAPYIDMIKALPAGIVVPLEGLTDLLFSLVIRPKLEKLDDDTYLSDPSFLTGPVTQPIMDGFTYDLVMEGIHPATITVLGELAEPATNEEAKPAPIPTRDKQTDIPAAVDHNEVLAELFDPVPVEALEKMFPAGGKWKGWADKAKAKELAHARVGRAKFNPYKAGFWFVKRGVSGWDIARLYRVLASNLPPRSFDNRHLLTGSVE